MDRVSVSVAVGVTVRGERTTCQTMHADRQQPVSVLQIGRLRGST